MSDLAGKFHKKYEILAIFIYLYEEIRGELCGPRSNYSQLEFA
jgi:hypothetical protein